MCVSFFKRKELLQKIFLQHAHKQQGSSVVTFLLVLPVLCGLICAIVDFGRFAYLQLELNTATQSACKNACMSSLAGQGGSAMKNKIASVIENDPEFSQKGFDCTVLVKLKNKGDVKFDSFSYSGSDENNASTKNGFVKNEVLLQSYEVVVDTTLECACLTPVGAALSSATGRQGFITLNAHAQGIYWVGDKKS